MKKVLCIILMFALAGCASREEVSEKFAEIYQSPPALTVICGESEIEAMHGTSSWHYKNEDGTVAQIESDSMYPLLAKEHMPILKLFTSTLSHKDPLAAELVFEESPDKISALLE